MTVRTREELLELWRRDPEAVVKSFESLLSKIEALEERIRQLEAQLKQDSHNSHKPPSSDGLKRITKSARPKSNRSPGAQPGHEGTTLKMVARPDRVVRHQVVECRSCGRSLKRIQAQSYRRRQVFDIPEPRMEVTEHECEVKECPRCGTTTTASFPAEVTKAAQYGKTIKSIGTYLMQYQLLPSERTQAALADLFGCSVAEGTLFNWAKELHSNVEEPERKIKEQVAQAPVIHTDETGLFCEQKLQWLHVVSTPELTYYRVHPKRGKKAMDAIGILPDFTGKAIHDSWKPYFTYDCEHGLCNGHLIRELSFAYEQDQQRWAKKFSKLLLRIDRKVEDARCQNKASLPSRTLRHFEHQYERLLAHGLRSNPRQRGSPHRRGRKKQTKTRNLLERLQKYRPAVLAFMYDFRVPFTNNQAERDLRMTKVKQKISGTFRSQRGAEIFCRIRGYISTARKNGISAFDAVSRAFTGDPFIPVVNYAE
jgi:transposase